MATGERTLISAADGVADAYVSRPEDAPAQSGVLLFMDGIGLRPQIEQMADRIATRGHTVLAPNVFYRDGPAHQLRPQEDLRRPGARARFFTQVRPRIAAHTPTRAARDLPHYIDALAAEVGDASPKFGVVGYCMGGALAVRAAAQLPDRFGAVVLAHAGDLVTDRDDSPHRQLGAVRAELAAMHADDDPSMPPASIVEFDRARGAAGEPGTSVVYPGAAHGFTMADTPMFHEDAAEQHFATMLDLFARALHPPAHTSGSTRSP